jgi:hypothetical protein
MGLYYREDFNQASLQLRRIRLVAHQRSQRRTRRRKGKEGKGRKTTDEEDRDDGGEQSLGGHEVRKNHGA